MDDAAGRRLAINRALAMRPTDPAGRAAEARLKEAAERKAIAKRQADAERWIAGIRAQRKR